ncbi:hypothetical protein [Flammeovirga pacifica]|uniref:hypothetical protein n=1 Tax=Flammeovirga pacifica TaxID=915059 RepID=UPI0013018EC8|nr:hypothetical protein [Flammeovirga pacifica]
MKDIIEILKGFLAVFIGLVIVFGTVSVLLPKDHNKIADVPQTHVYVGQDLQK